MDRLIQDLLAYCQVSRADPGLHRVDLAGAAPAVRVRAERRAGRVRVWVEDDGIGIAPEHDARIFRVFERLHGSEAYPGTGIGLAIVKKAVERLGGEVGVESAPGQGSRFWNDLAAAPESA